MNDDLMDIIGTVLFILDVIGVLGMLVAAIWLIATSFP